MFGNPYVLAGIAAAWLASCAFAGYEGWHLKSQSDQAALASAEAHVVEVAAQQTAITFQTQQVYDTAKLEIATVAQTLILKVPTYVSPKSDAACTVPVGFVRVYDAPSGLSPVPDAAGRTDDAASGVALSGIAESLIDNKASCADDRAKLSALQSWITAEGKLK